MYEEVTTKELLSTSSYLKRCKAISIFWGTFFFAFKDILVGGGGGLFLKCAQWSLHMWSGLKKTLSWTHINMFFSEGAPTVAWIWIRVAKSYYSKARWWIRWFWCCTKKVVHIFLLFSSAFGCNLISFVRFIVHLVVRVVVPLSRPMKWSFEGKNKLNDIGQNLLLGLCLIILQWLSMWVWGCSTNYRSESSSELSSSEVEHLPSTSSPSIQSGKLSFLLSSLCCV